MNPLTIHDPFKKAADGPAKLTGLPLVNYESHKPMSSPGAILGLASLIVAFSSGPTLAGAEITQQPMNPSHPGAPLLLVPARVFDAEDGKVHENWVVLVEGKTISAVGAKDQVKAPPGARPVSLPD